MKHLSARAVLGAFAIVPIIATGGAGVAAASSGAAVDGDCPPTYRLVPADSELRQRITPPAAPWTGSSARWSSTKTLSSTATS